MRVTCPSCLHSFQADDNESGKTVRCPACGDTFAAPVLMHPAGGAAGVSAAQGRSPAYPAPYPAHGHAASGEEVSYGAPPPGPENAGPAPGAAPAPPPSAADLYGLTQLRYIPLRLSVVRWIPVACLILAFLLTFFTWVGAYPAGYAAYTQSGWQAMFASFSTDAVSDTKVLKDADGNGLSMRIKEHISPNLLMLPFLLFLALAMVLAVWVQLVEMGRLYVPVWAQRYWPYRMIGLIVLTGLSLLLYLLQTSFDLGLENALREVARQQAPAPEAAAQPQTSEEIQEARMKVAMEYGKYHVRTTTWFALTGLLLSVALAALGLQEWLESRGDRPPPRVALVW